MNTIEIRSLLVFVTAAAAAFAAAACEHDLAGAPCPCVSGFTCCTRDNACYPAGTGCPGADGGGGPGAGNDGGGPGRDGGGPASVGDAATGTPTVFPHLCTSDGWCGATPTFSAVWGSAPDDIWVAAPGVNDHATLTALLHFDGTGWTDVAFGSGSGGTAVGEIASLWGTAANDVFAVGYSGVLHFDGAAWSDRSPVSPSVSNYTPNFRGVSGSAPDDVWVVGKQGAMAHFDGTGWTRLGPTDGGPDLAAVWVHDRATAWAVGAAGVILRYDGASWSRVGDGFGGTPTTEDLTAIWGSAADDVWAAGRNGTVLHFDGASWQNHSYDVPTRSDLTALWGNGRDGVWAAGAGGALVHWTGAAWYTAPSGTTETLRGLWASSGGDIWAVGDTSASVHWDGAAWAASPPPPETWGRNVTTPPPPDMLPKSLRAVWGSGPRDVWAAGDAGAMVHWDGGQWSGLSVGGLGQSYRGIWGDGNGSTWFVGAGGTIVASYDPLRGPYAPWAYDMPDLNAIWGTARDNVWAVGTGGAIVHLDGQTWTAFPSPTSADIKSLWGFAADDIWASTRSEDVLHFDGTAWSASAVIAPEGDTTLNWYAVFGLAPNDLWLTGSYTISGYMSGSGGAAYLHWDGSTWSRPDVTESLVPFAASGSSVWQSDAASLWIAEPGTVLHLQGSVPTRSLTGATTAINAIWGSGPDDIWAVGDKGMILHRHATAP